MTYTVIPTQATGDVWSVTDMNTYIRDNFAAGVPDIFTAKGDLAVATAADVAVPFPVGTDGRTLTAESSTSTGLMWFASGVSATGTTHVTSGEAWVWIALDTEVYDISGEFASYIFTATYPGYYLTTAVVKFEVTPSGLGTAFDAGELVAIAVYKNNALYTIIGMNYIQVNGQLIAYCNGSDTISLAAGDTLKLYGYVGTAIVNGDGVDVNGTVTIHRIGGA
jgi:hypothetical protein